MEPGGSLCAEGKLLEHQRQSTELQSTGHFVVQEVQHWWGKGMVERCTEGQLDPPGLLDILKRHHFGDHHFLHASLNSACCAGSQYPPQGLVPEEMLYIVHLNGH